MMRSTAWTSTRSIRKRSISCRSLTSAPGEILHLLPEMRYENDRVELPLRAPGAPTWPNVARHGREVRREERKRQREAEEQQRHQAREQTLEKIEAVKSSESEESLE